MNPDNGNAQSVFHLCISGKSLFNNSLIFHGNNILNILYVLLLGLIGKDGNVNFRQSVKQSGKATTKANFFCPCTYSQSLCIMCELKQ